MTNRTDAFRKLGLAAIAVAIMATARDASAVERKGFVFGLGLGGGKITCDGCESLSGPAVAIHIGGMVTEKLAIVLDSSGVGKEEDGVTLTSVVSGPAVQYWVSPKVWVKGGVGLGQARAWGDGFDAASETGLGFLAGLGVEVLQKQKFVIDLQFRFTTASIDGTRTNNIFGVVGFNFY